MMAGFKGKIVTNPNKDNINEIKSKTKCNYLVLITLGILTEIIKSYFKKK